MDEGLTNEQFLAVQQKDLYAIKNIVNSKEFDETVKAQILKEIEAYYQETSGK
ncbi:MAG: hypothetical protein PUJ57_03670 [Peptoniphilaceae bacterium]|nr:hypothetical protein [Peptoniphilaceae bacterium]MDY6085153.1 hypothetical protein [Peptoniphilaceae bacterium]